MPFKTEDAIRRWFSAAEDLGEYIGIRFGYISPSGGEPEWTFLPHSEVDGIGGLAQLLRRRGADLSSLPQLKHPAPFSPFALVRLLPKYFGPRHRLTWIQLEGQPQPSSHTRPPSALAWHVFDERTTMSVRRVCRRASVTVNSFLLKHLTKAIRPSLQDQSALVPWMIPVNLRGKVFRQHDVENHSSYICVSVRSYETVYDVHRRIYRALARGEHWANWHAYKSGNFLSAAMRRFVVRIEHATAQWNIGGYSNLGDWDPEQKITQAGCRGSWLFSPPVLRCQMLGVGCVTFQNRLALVIQVHPELTTSSAAPRRWMEAWVKEIEMDIASVLSEPIALHSTTG
jgi:hypothetical protein